VARQHCARKYAYEIRSGQRFAVQRRARRTSGSLMLLRFPCGGIVRCNGLLDAVLPCERILQSRLQRREPRRIHSHARRRGIDGYKPPWTSGTESVFAIDEGCRGLLMFEHGPAEVGSGRPVVPNSANLNRCDRKLSNSLQCSRISHLRQLLGEDFLHPL